MAEQEPNAGWTETLGSEASSPPAPRTSGDQLFALGEWWTVSSCENRIKAQVEQWVRRNAKRAIAEEGNPEEANALRSAYMADYGSGHYNWDGRHVRSARGDLPGLRYLLFLLLKRCHPDMTEAKAEAIFRDNPQGCGAAIGWALGNASAPSETKTTDGEKTNGPWPAGWTEERARKMAETLAATPVTLGTP